MAIVQKETAYEFRRLKMMGESSLAIVDAMLYKGTEAAVVARHIKYVLKEFKDVSELTLTKQLLRYKKKELSGQWLSRTAKEDGTHLPGLRKMVEGYKEKLDAHELMQELVIIQHKRVSKVLRREEKLPTNLESVRRDIDTYSSILTKFANLQMDLGYMKRAPLLVAHVAGYSEESIIEAERVTSEIKINEAKSKILSNVLTIIAGEQDDNS